MGIGAQASSRTAGVEVCGRHQNIKENENVTIIST